MKDIVDQLRDVSFADPNYALYRKAADEIMLLRGAAKPPADPPRERWYFGSGHLEVTGYTDADPTPRSFEPTATPKMEK